ncbi:MAG: hypothetical protein Q8J88_15400 [Bacteroidales bacterium]|nr:hypothetical protein [Bacteroidales bacterium]
MDVNEMIFSIALHSGLRPEKEANLSALIALIGTKDAELSKLVQQYKNAADAYQYIKGDHELRHKVKDIWEMHRNRTKAEFQQSQKILADYCTKAGLPVDFPTEI